MRDLEVVRVRVRVRFRVTVRGTGRV